MLGACKHLVDKGQRVPGFHPLFEHFQEGVFWSTSDMTEPLVRPHPSSVASDACDNYANCGCHYVNTCLCQI